MSCRLRAALHDFALVVDNPVFVQLQVIEINIVKAVPQLEVQNLLEVEV
jgi:hypothetical protein